MPTTYAQKQAPAQKKDAPTAASVLDTSSQSESLQRKADMANNAAQREEAPRPNNTGMPDNLKAGIESLSGFSMDDVRVHYNSSKPATVQALAYTQGTDIHVAPGQEKHLPHEAWHVAQQMAGRVSPTTNINGMPVNDNAALEHEADVMGEKAVQCKKMNNLVTSVSSALLGVAQMVKRVANIATGVIRKVRNNYQLKEGEEFVPYGFATYEDYRDSTRPYAKFFRNGRFIIRGSSVRNRSYPRPGKPQHPFRESSDYDLGVIYDPRNPDEFRDLECLGPYMTYYDDGYLQGFFYRDGLTRKGRNVLNGGWKLNGHDASIRIWDHSPSGDFIERPHTPPPEQTSESFDSLLIP